MPKLRYEEFITRVDELGFIAGSRTALPGFPSVDDLVSQGQWFCGDPDYDPWLWKDRAPSEKRLAYGPFFAGKRGFIAPRFYSLFRDAFRPRASLEARREAGLLGRYEWLVWELLLREGRPLGTHEYRAMLGVTAKSGRGAADGAVIQLQLTMDVAACGSVDILDKHGRPYSVSVGFQPADAWAPAEWLHMNPPMEHEAALDALTRHAAGISRRLDAAGAGKLFSRQVKAYQRYAGV